MTKRKPVAVLLLPFVTFGISMWVWIIGSKREMVARGADIPTSWLLIAPFANIWYIWKWSQGVEKVTNKGMSSIEAFLVMLFLGPIGHAIVQSKFNKEGFCMSSFFSLITLFLILGANPALAASNLEEGVSQLATQISKSMQEKQKQKIAILDFSDLNGNVTSLGQFMAEELTTQLFMVAPGKFEVVERRQLLKLEEELMLGQTGFIEEKSIKKMGQVLGVDAIVTGSMTDLGNTVKINARLIGVESAKVFAVAATDIPKTGMVADLIAKQVEKRQGAIQAASASGAPEKQGVKTETKQTTEAMDFLFVLQGCKASGGNVTCNILITNKGNDRELQFVGRSFGKDSRLFDDMGNEYPASEVQLGNKQHGHSVTTLLVSNIPTKARVSFEKVSAEAGKISLLELATITKDWSIVQFRDIPLSK